ncbi:MAG: magnesium/cobalt transporter CorA [Sediminimonas qiaohouensis]|uniref:Magnesium transport protein CorA n=1 Tax=Sediminimonas qiaohouensis TaxID=552061 RepID=A0A7C9LC36_9RHOB|nr:magnesium/cobalt transporter CorA [Sediminimonas qiaohouensis]MTJ05838.1 magnesium/cobalt transporter CorA [Sediminimonas qiaohouensis]
MITSYAAADGHLVAQDSLLRNSDALVWIDLFNPTHQEETELEDFLGINVPTREEMEEIEISSRLYSEDEAIFMTAILPAHGERDDPDMLPVSFVLIGKTLVTVRYHTPRAFTTFPQRAAKASVRCETGELVLVALLEAIVDRLADILERDGRDIELISRDVFRPDVSKPTRGQTLQATLEAIGRKGDLTSNIRNSLATLERVVAYLAQQSATSKGSRNIRERNKALAHDIGSLADHAGFLSQKITFLLDATLGMISIEQNAIIKILSVAAVVFLPPTLVASVYGMNFEHMPELAWLAGYPFAILLMIITATLPYLYFKRRGWL